MCKRMNELLCIHVCAFMAILWGPSDTGTNIEHPGRYDRDAWWSTAEGSEAERNRPAQSWPYTLKRISKISCNVIIYDILLCFYYCFNGDLYFL